MKIDILRDAGRLWRVRDEGGRATGDGRTLTGALVMWAEHWEDAAWSPPAALTPQAPTPENHAHDHRPLVWLDALMDAAKVLHAEVCLIWQPGVDSPWCAQMREHESQMPWKASNAPTLEAACTALLAAVTQTSLPSGQTYGEYLYWKAERQRGRPPPFDVPGFQD